MDHHQIKQHLTDLVLDGREEVAIEEMLAISNSCSDEIRNNITSLSKRYRKFEGEKMSGSLSIDKINTTSDRISQALMFIIEQLTEENESGQHTVDLDAIFDGLDDSSEASSDILPKVKSKTLKRIAIIVPACLALIVAILAFNGRFSKTNNPGKAALDMWIGVWHHEMESAGDSKITGSLSFEMASDNQLVGRASYLFPDGSETTNTLSKIEFSRQGKVMEGIWQTDNVQSLRGTFKFHLDNPNQFAGFYTVINQDGEFDWNGTK